MNIVRVFHSQYALVFLFLFFSFHPEATVAQPVIDVTTEPVAKIDKGITSKNFAVYGVQLGMNWEDARSILSRKDIPYLFAKTVPIMVYIPPKEPTFYFSLNPSTYEIVEIGVMGEKFLPVQNRYIADGLHWRLTTARTYFFGIEGARILNEEGQQFNYPELGFSLKYISNRDFRFVMVEPESVPRIIPKPKPDTLFVPKPFTVTVPFFVTGYYFPNTSAEWKRLQERIAKGELIMARYIDARKPENGSYDEFSRIVDNTFQEIQSYIEQNLSYLAKYEPHVKLTMHIGVEGYVDPRPLTKGEYLDEDVTLPDGRVLQRGSMMKGDEGNGILAFLRAHFTAQYIDRYMMDASGQYRAANEQGRIVWDEVNAGGVGRAADLPKMRHIQLRLRFERN